MERVKRASGIEEIVCEHDVGHPTYKSAVKVAKRLGHDIGTWMVHGCDGCCRKIKECHPEEPIKEKENE